MNKNIIAAAAALVIAGTALAPITANAQSSADRQYHHRQQTKNQWRNIGIGSAALGALGFLKGNTTLGLAGVAGAAYSANRYEHDRRSQRSIGDRRESARAYYHRSHHRTRHRRHHRHS